MAVDTSGLGFRLNTDMEGAGFMMKIVLQNRVSWKYYGDTGSWVENIEQAHCFASSMEALSFAQKQNLREVQIVFKFPKDRYDFTVPVRDAGGQDPPRPSV